MQTQADFNRVIRKVAEKYGVSCEEVYAGMQEAISAARRQNTRLYREGSVKYFV